MQSVARGGVTYEYMRSAAVLAYELMFQPTNCVQATCRSTNTRLSRQESSCLSRHVIVICTLKTHPASFIAYITI